MSSDRETGLIEAMVRLALLDRLPIKKNVLHDNSCTLASKLKPLLAVHAAKEFPMRWGVQSAGALSALSSIRCSQASGD